MTVWISDKFLFEASLQSIGTKRDASQIGQTFIPLCEKVICNTARQNSNLAAIGHCLENLKCWRAETRNSTFWRPNRAQCNNVQSCCIILACVQHATHSVIALCCLWKCSQKKLWFRSQVVFKIGVFFFPTSEICDTCITGYCIQTKFPYINYVDSVILASLQLNSISSERKCRRVGLRWRRQKPATFFGPRFRLYLFLLTWITSSK